MKDIIEAKKKEFLDKTDSEKLRSQQLPYHELDKTDHLMDESWFPESPYELDREKIAEWLEEALSSIAKTAEERGEAKERERIADWLKEHGYYHEEHRALFQAIQSELDQPVSSTDT